MSRGCNPINRLLGSAGIDVEQQFPVFSDGTPPLFRQTPHIVDQSHQVILVNRYPLWVLKKSLNADCYETLGWAVNK